MEPIKTEIKNEPRRPPVEKRKVAQKAARSDTSEDGAKFKIVAKIPTHHSDSDASGAGKANKNKRGQNGQSVLCRANKRGVAWRCA